MVRFAPLVLVFAAQAHAATDDWAWLAGDWMQCRGSEVVEEHWLGPRDGSVLVGANLPTANGKATFEHLRIAQADGTWTYFASPGGRPATPFRLAERGPESATFENPDNRFPSRIVYRRDGALLVARVEGTMKDKPASVEWRFARATAEGCPR